MQIQNFQIKNKTKSIIILYFLLALSSNAISINVINNFPKDSYITNISPGRLNQMNKITFSFFLNKTINYEDSAYLSLSILNGRISFLSATYDITCSSKEMQITSMNLINETNAVFKISSLEIYFTINLTFYASYEETIDISLSLYLLSNDLINETYLIKNTVSSVRVLALPAKEATLNIININNNMKGDYIFNFLLDKAIFDANGIKISFPKLNQGLEGVSKENEISLFPYNTDLIGLVQYNGLDKNCIIIVNKQENYILISPIVQEQEGYLSFKLTNILLPVSTKTLYLYFEIGKQNLEKDKFDFINSSDYLPINSNHNQPIMNFHIAPNTKVAGETTDYIITFLLAYFLPQDACIYIKFPTFRTDSYDLKSITSVIYMRKNLYFEIQSDLLVIYFQNEYLNLTNLLESTMSLTIKNITNPLTTEDSIDFFKSGIFYFDRSNTLNEVYTLYDHVNIKMTNNSFYSINVIASNLLVSEINVNYDIHIKVSMSTPKDSIFQIQLPNELLFTNNTTALEIELFTIPLEVNKLSKTISLKTSISLNKKDEIIIRLTNIQNFGDTRMSTPFVISSFDSNSKLLESNNTDAKVKFISGICQITSIKRSNDKCGSNTDLIIEMTFQSQLIYGSKINLTFPAELGFVDHEVQNSIELLLYDRILVVNNEEGIITYTPGKLRSIQLNYTISIQSHKEFNTKTLVISFTSNSAIDSQSYFVLKLNKGIRNPRSFKETSLFYLSSTSSDGYLIDEYKANDSYYPNLINYTERTIINNTTAILPFFKITSNNYTTGYQEDDLVYTIKFFSSISFYSNDILKIILPNDIKLGQVRASTKEGKIITVISQKSINNYILLTNLPSYIASDENYPKIFTEDRFALDQIIHINLYGLRNPLSLLKTDSFIIHLISHDGFLIARNLSNAENPSNQTSIMMKESASMSNCKLSYFEKNNSEKLLLFEFDLKNYSRIADIINKESLKIAINILIPDEFIFSNSIECYKLVNSSTKTEKEYYDNCRSSDNIITIILTNKLLEENTSVKNKIYPVSVIMKNLLPKESILYSNLKQTKAFIIEVYLEKNNSKYLIENYNTLYFTFKCNDHCTSCDMNNNNCLSCFKSSSLPYLYNGQCTSICPSGTSLNESNYTCEICNLKCSECKNNAINYCHSCINKYDFLIEDQGLCVSHCPPGYYAQLDSISNINKCYPCKKHCAKCESDETCLECIDGFFPNKGICVDKCSETMFLSVDKNNNRFCSDCSSECLTCNNKSKQCTSCNLNFILYENRCLLKCPTGMTNNGKECIKCPEGCADCDIITDKLVCLVCQSSHYFNSLHQAT